MSSARKLKTVVLDHEMWFSFDDKFVLLDGFDLFFLDKFYFNVNGKIG